MITGVRIRHEAVGLRDRGGPSLHDFVLVRRATRRGRRCWLIEERHREVAKIEKPSVDILRFFRRCKIHFAGFSEKRPSRVLPTMTEMGRPPPKKELKNSAV